MAFRIDAIGKLGRAVRTPQGGARIPAALTRSGILTYKNPDGSTRREYRPPSEVFSTTHLDSFKSAPVTEGHRAWVTPSNYQTVSLGHVADGSVRRDGDKVAAELVVNEADALERVDTGELRDVSAG